MKAIHIRDIPESILEGLKRRAQLHHRSLQGELHAILTEATQVPLLGEPEPFALKKVQTSGNQNWSREALYED